MEDLILTFFPYPTVHKGIRREGHVYPSTDQCKRCKQQCESSDVVGIGECPYGINFLRHGDLLVYGFIANMPGATSAAKKKSRRNNPGSITKSDSLDKALTTYDRTAGELHETIADSKRKIVEEYRADKGYQKDILELLRPEIRQKLAFLHDYKQFIARVKQNINVVIETRYTAASFEEKLRRASKPEGAIYWASELMEEKLDTISLLTQPDRLFTAKPTLFRVHGAVLKYCRIYQAAFDEKGVRVNINGDSVGRTRGNAKAFGVIPHALIDNALKYSVRGSWVTISFEETAQEIGLAVTSFGPKIENEELGKIFEMFFRGGHAIKHEHDGAGFGLYLAQTVACQLDTKIEVHQSATAHPFGFETRFSIRLHRID